MEPVSLSDLSSAVRGQASGLDGNAANEARRVCIDSRELQPGDVFWALPGETRDGHVFVDEAFRKGAAACVVERQRLTRLQTADQTTGPLVQVENTWAALADFARWYRQRREALVIGVTGSVGKTTTKEMTYAALSGGHRGIRSQKSFNNELGLPLSLLDLEDDDEFGVFEMGASRIGEIRSLCEIAHPEAGVIPKVGISHLESFGSREGIYQAKGELLESLPSHGFAAVGGDDEGMRTMAQRAKCPVIFVGEQPGNQVRPSEIDATPQRLRLAVDGTHYELPGAGRQHVTAALCAIAVAREIGLSPSDVASGLQQYSPPPGRGRAEACGPWTLIDDTYNANPTSMEAALLALQSWPATGPKIFVAGDMLELGPEAADLHARVGLMAAKANVDRLLAIGRFAKPLVQGAIAGGLPRTAAAECSDWDVLWMLLDCWLVPGAVVVVKGSRATRMERVVEWIRKKGEGDRPRKVA